MKKNLIEAGSADLLAGLQVDLLQKIRSGKISLEEFRLFLNLSAKKRAELLGMKLPQQTLVTDTSHLHLLSGGQEIVISACPGGSRESLAYAGKTFTGYVDGNFKNWKLDTEQPTTEATPVLVYELHKDGRFMDIFGSFNVDKKALAFESQEQVEKFAIEHRAWLRTDGYGTFFLFTEMVDNKEEFFVARVRFGDDGRLGVYVRRLSSDVVWLAGVHHRVVVSATGLLGA